MINALLGIGASLLSGMAQRKAAKNASKAQTAASNAQIAESRRQFDLVQGLMKPYVTAGGGALQGQMNLVGLNGQPAQQTAIDGIANGPMFQEMAEQGEYGIMANASATGGLRGGDIQGAFAQFRPQMLQSLIDRQLAQYGGLAANGQNAAGMTGTAAQNTGQQVNQSLGQIGAAQAGRAIANGQATQNMVGGVMEAVGQYAPKNWGLKF